MSDLTAVPSTKKMLSVEIATLTGKNHKDVMRDIRVITEQMQRADLLFACESTTYEGSNGQSYPCFTLDYEATMTVLTGYDVTARAKVIKRWQELEAKVAEAPKPLSHLEILSQSIQILTEHDKRLTSAETEVKQIASKVESLSIDLRNGVPHGFISRSNAWRIYSQGLSKDVFELIMSKYDVPTQKYVHTAEGHSTATHGYQEDKIVTNVAHFIRNLVQTTPKMCYSELLNRKVFYIKPVPYGLTGESA